MANGDVADRRQALALVQMGAAAVAVGRGALGRPYVFAELQGNSYTFDVPQAIRRHAELLSKVFAERVVTNEMKKHVAAYLKGKRGCKQVCVQVMTAENLQQIFDACDTFFAQNNT